MSHPVGTGGPSGVTLTVKGSPATSSQLGYAGQIIGFGKSINASAVAVGAVIVEAIAESALGVPAYMGWDSSNPTYGGLLAGNIATFGHLGGSTSQAVTSAEINAAFKGGQGYVTGGAIGLARSQSDLLQIAMTNSGSGTQFLGQAGHQNYASEARAILAAGGGGTLPLGGTATLPGGTAGAGGTGTLPNSTSASGFRIGDPTNPDEDYWTGMNRIAQERYWLLFADGETLYLADGPDLIAQTPALQLDRIGDAATINSLEFTFDNTAFQFVATHHKRNRAQRRTALAKVTSPVEGQLTAVCEIDAVRAGDVVEFSNTGPGDGRWLAGNVRRSIFDVLSEINVVFALTPLTEKQLSTGVANPFNTAGVNPQNKGTTPVLQGTGTLGTTGLVSPFRKKYTANLANTDMGVDFGRQQGIATGDPILAIGDCYLRSITTFYQGQPGMWFEFAPAGKTASGYWGWYVAEEINPKLGTSGTLVAAGTVVATYAASGTGIEIGWAASAGTTATQAFHPGEVAGRHAGNGTTDGRAFLAFLQKVGAV